VPKVRSDLRPRVSVIIPVRGDAPALATLLADCADHADGADSDSADYAELEVIVSCAWPVDPATVDVLRRHPSVRCIEAAPGRGSQLNAGAAVARGEWLWFVHADSRLPDAWLEAFRNLDRLPSAVVGGAFRFRLDSHAWQARVLERGVALRVRWFNLPYGDQGIFVRRDIFAQLGGFRAIPLMEDVEFMGRLKAAGELRHLTLSLVTSARRWERDGWWRRSVKNLATLLLYRLGVSPDRLARRYYGHSHSRGRHADQEPR
jgi:rSAM/selenodomain-associated transferase 2